jgi:vacuolar protein sorting-associated protein 53
MLGKYRGARSRASLDTPAGEDAPATVVLPSSTELFYFYAQSLDSCAKLSVGIGKILLDLAGVQKKWLRTYAGRYPLRMSSLCFTPE